MAESGLGLAALTKNQDAKNRYTVGTFPRESVSPRMAAVLDRLARDPITRDVGIVSGPRDTAYNKAVGGARASQHKYSNALDLGFKSLPPSTKAHVLNKMVEAGVSRFGLYSSGAFHFDVRPGAGFWGALKNAAYTGMTAAQLGKLPEWARGTIKGLVEGSLMPNTAGLPAFEKNLIDNKTEIQASLPYRMDDPRFTPALEMGARPPAMPGALAPYTPPAKAAGTPLSLNSMVAGRPEYPGSMPAAPAPSVPRGAVYAGIGAMDRALPSLGSIASSYIGGKPSRPSIGPARENPPALSRPTVATRPDVPVGRLPAAPSMRQPAGTPTASHQPSLSHPKSTAATPRAAVDAAIDGPLGLGAGANALSASTARNVAAGTQAAQAKAYAEYEANRAKAFSAMPAPSIAPSTAKLAAQYAQYQPSLQVTPTAQPLQHPISVPPAPVAPPALTVPPAPVLAPLLAQPKVVKDYPVAEVAAPPAPPRATAYDVYNGLADTALDNTGKNTISAMPGGGTSVTNQYGATTGMTPGGYQTAVGSLPGISGPSLGKFGGAIKGAIPGVAGSALGGLLGGPVGALIGAALAKAATQPGGVLSGVNSFNTDYFGQLNAAKAQGGLGFPDAPTRSFVDSSGRTVRGYTGSASFSNRSRNEMDSISPGASAAIGRGLGGLY